MVTHDRIKASNARNDSLTATTIPGHRMKRYSPGEDQFVCLNGRRVDINVIPIAGPANAGQLGRIMAIMLDNTQTPDHVLTANEFILGLRVGPVRSRCDEDRNLLICYANAV